MFSYYINLTQEREGLKYNFRQVSCSIEAIGHQENRKTKPISETALTFEAVKHFYRCTLQTQSNDSKSTSIHSDRHKNEVNNQTVTERKNIRTK